MTYSDCGWGGDGFYSLEVIHMVLLAIQLVSAYCNFTLSSDHFDSSKFNSIVFHGAITPPI